MLDGLFLVIPPLPPLLASEMTEVCYRYRLPAPTESHGRRAREGETGHCAEPSPAAGQLRAQLEQSVTVLCENTGNNFINTTPSSQLN